MPRAGAPERKRIPTQRSLAARKAARQGISLRGIGISISTENRYLSAVAQLIPILEQAAALEELDLLCEEWVEHHWQSGTPLGTIGDALCGLHFFWPQVKGYLRGSWKLYKNWRRIEVPQRAPPLPRQICVALVGYFLHREQVTMAFLLALGYHAYLRTGELLKLRCQDFIPLISSGTAVAPSFATSFMKELKHCSSNRWGFSPTPSGGEGLRTVLPLLWPWIGLSSVAVGDLWLLLGSI